MLKLIKKTYNKEELINLYNKLYNNIKKPNHYYKMTEILENLFCKDPIVATTLSLIILDKYGHCYYEAPDRSEDIAAIHCLIDTILILLFRHNPYKKVLSLIKTNVKNDKSLDAINEYISNYRYKPLK